MLYLIVRRGLQGFKVVAPTFVDLLVLAICLARLELHLDLKQEPFGTPPRLYPVRSA